jgi:hypothetical protein
MCNNYVSTMDAACMMLLLPLRLERAGYFARTVRELRCPAYAAGTATPSVRTPVCVRVCVCV